MEQAATLGNPLGFAADGSQYLTFSVGEEEYGVEILRVQEIRGSAPITPIPNTPSHVKGVMNLRGTIIPVVDLSSRLSIGEAERKPSSVIVVVTVGSKVQGMIVDAVSDVVGLCQSDIQPAPDLGAGAEARFVKGVAKAGEKLVILLDLDQVLGQDTGARAASAS